MNKRVKADQSPDIGEDDFPELTEADIDRLVPFSALPEDEQRKLKSLKSRGRGPQKAPTKVPVNIRLSPDVVEYFRETGSGWQGRIDAVLSDFVERMRKAG